MMRSTTVFIVVCIFAGLAMAEDYLMPNETWDSGYITVRGEGNELFYYLVQSRDKNESAPLIIWLNGGPGCSSSYGIFTENGPWLIHPKELVFFRNEYSWNSFADMLFIDQPVQVGFSLVKKDQDLCINETCVVNDFYSFLLKFLEKHPQYEKRPLYITGESYGGHYVPSIAARLARVKNPLLNLKGIAVGNPFTSMAVQLGPYAYFLFENQNFTLNQYVIAKMSSLICQIGHYVELKPEMLTKLCDFSLGGMVDLPNDYDIREKESYDKMDEVLMKKYNDPAIRKLIHAKKDKMSLCNDTIYDLFSVDLATSMSPEVEFLLESKIDVMLYFGDKDYICNWRGGEALANSLKWQGSQGFSKTAMKEWTVGGRYRKYDNFNFMVIYGAGHMVPMNQRKVALEMIKSFVDRRFQ